MAPTSTTAADTAAREGHDEPTNEMRHVWGTSELDLLMLTAHPDTTHTARKVSEDPMLEEVAASLLV